MAKFTGTDLDDEIVGSAGEDDIKGGDGDDRIDGGAGNDDIKGGDGDDRIEGGAGNDDIKGGDGLDIAAYDALPSNVERGKGNSWLITVGGWTDTLKQIEEVHVTFSGTEYHFVLDGSNNAPIAFDDTGATDEDTPLTLSAASLLANDYDFEVDGLTIASASAPQHGTVTFDNGTITFTPDVNYFGPASFVYAISDGNGGSDTAAMAITVASVNDDPTAVDDTGAVSEDGPAITIDLLANDIDIDGDTLTIDSFDFTGLQGIATDNGDGTITYDPNGAFESLNDGDTAVDVFSYTVADGNSGSDTAEVNITVEGTASPCFPVLDGLVSWWPGDGNANDVVGDNHGTMQNGATFSSGKIDQAFDLTDPSIDYVSVPNDLSLSLTSAFTVDAWVNRDSANALWDPIVKQAGEGGAQQHGFALEYSGSGVRFWVYTNGGGWQASPIAQGVPDGEWSHLAGIYDGSSLTLYLNGDSVGTAAAAGTSMIPSGNDLNIGRDPSNGGRFFDGLIDEVHIFDRALTAEEIRSIFVAGADGKCNSLGVESDYLQYDSASMESGHVGDLLIA